MEVWKIKVQDDKGPFTGAGVVVVIKEFDDAVTVLHPWSFTIWSMPRSDRHDSKGDLVAEGFEQSKVELIWKTDDPINSDAQGLIKTFNRKLETENALSRGIPYEAISFIMSNFTGQSQDDIKDDFKRRGLKEGDEPEVKRRQQAELKKQRVEDREAKQAAKAAARQEKQENKMKEKAAKKAAKKSTKKAAPKADATPKVEGKFVANDKMDMDKNVPRGQGKLVATVLKRRTVPATAAEISEAVKAAGGYKLKDGIELVDSVRYHLNKFVADGIVDES